MPSAVYFPITGNHLLLWQEQGRGSWVIGGEFMQGKWPIPIFSLHDQYIAKENCVENEETHEVAEAVNTVA